MNTEQQLEKVKDKIEKLFRKAESAGELGSLEEAAIFAAKANEILTKHNLEMADINLETDINSCEGDRVFVKDEHGWSKTDSDWLIKLYGTICRYNFCKIVIHTMIRGQDCTIIGEPHNIEMVKYVVSHLVPKIKQLRLRRWKEYHGYEKTNAFKRSYFRGAVMGIELKLREQRLADEVKYDGLPGLVVLTNKLIDEKMAELFKNLKYGSRGRGLSGHDGGSLGVADGKRMSINRGIGAGNGSSGRLLN